MTAFPIDEQDFSYRGWQIEFARNGEEIRIQHESSSAVWRFDADGNVTIPGDADIGGEVAALRATLAAALDADGNDIQNAGTVDTETLELGTDPQGGTSGQTGDRRLTIAETDRVVEIETAAGHTITLDDRPGEESVTVEDETGNNEIELDSVEGSVSITGQSEVSIDAPTVSVSADELTLEGEQTEIDSGTRFAVNATQAEINTRGNATVEATGILTLNGSLVNIN